MHNVCWNCNFIQTKQGPIPVFLGPWTKLAIYSGKYSRHFLKLVQTINPTYQINIICLPIWIVSNDFKIPRFVYVCRCTLTKGSRQIIFCFYFTKNTVHVTAKVSRQLFVLSHPLLAWRLANLSGACGNQNAIRDEDRAGNRRSLCGNL